MSQQRPVAATESRTEHATVETFEPEWGLIRLEFEMERDMAQTVYWVADEASVERSGYLKSAIQHELRAATEREEPRVRFSVTYYERDWRTWLSDLADQEPRHFNDRRGSYLEEFGELIEGL